MAPNPAAAESKKTERSYFSSAVDSINPWGGSRSSTPVPQKDETSPSFSPGLNLAGKGDHSKTHLYGRSLKSYPSDCPPLQVRWFHAVDAPKRKPQLVHPRRRAATDTKPLPQPKKFVAFSPSDSRSIESAYQRLLEESEDGRERWQVRHGSSRASTFGSEDAQSPGQAPRAGVKVPVNEDFLFDVDIRERELGPVYWEGPIYEVRRGSWYFQEGSTIRPCDENLAAQLEEGYLKVRPWLYPAPSSRRNSLSKPSITPKPSADNLRAVAAAQASSVADDAASIASRSRSSTNQHQPQSHRLFGTYMNNIATYQDSTTAWLSTDSMLSWVASSVYERFAGGGYMSGVKLVRGYSEPVKPKEREKEKEKDKEKDKDEAVPSISEEPVLVDTKTSKAAKRRFAPPVTGLSDEIQSSSAPEETFSRPRNGGLERQFSGLIDPSEAEEEIRKMEEQEIRDDYNAPAGETQNRDIEHLILVTHGIGQLLSLRMEGANFVHDVNVLRKSLKTVYSTSADLKALNAEIGEGPGNCKVQVLPVCWRHLLDFPKRQRRKAEHDLGDAASEEDEYPSLEDITIEGVAFARSLVSDLALDVLLYQSAYRKQISGIVLQEANRIHNLFRERNPDFNGKIHIMGHSLGSAIMFDILCRQRERKTEDKPRNVLGLLSSPDIAEARPKDEPAFDFNVDDLYCLGSPIGLFQMLKGRTIAARSAPSSLPSESPLNPDYMEDPFLSASAFVAEKVSPVTGLPISVSSPKVSQLFNIFHPSDPISYRIEPLVSSAMSALKPQSLPYTKKGIFGGVAPQGLTGIGAKVGQSVSGLFSSLSAGIASSLLNRSLGLTNEDVARMSAPSAAPSPVPGAANSSAEIQTDPSGAGERARKRKRQLADPTSSTGDQKSTSGNDVTLLDDELETLYSKFQKKRMDILDDKATGPEEWKEEDKKARQMRLEEMKVRALNRNGRVDYAIQESVLDFNPMNTIASHLGYWSDEDVAHFVLSQLLANRTRGRYG